MAQIDEEEISKLGKLCQIAFNDGEKQELLSRLKRVVAYVEQLQTVDTEGVDPCYTVLENHSHLMRSDEEGDSLSREDFLANSPSHVGGMIRVPPVIKF